MRHLDLFSGIGGFAYAVDQVWDNVEHIFCDNDKFCQKVIQKHWPNSYVYEDIRAITANTKHNGEPRPQTIRKNSSPQSKSQTREELFKPESTGTSGLWTEETGWKPVDILTGGFPCQPFSQAGKRRGTADNRYLWPEMLRVIQTTKPSWIVAENVRGLLTWNEGMVFEQVCADLEGEGYEVQAFVVPAVAVNAPHRRDRVWFVANYSRKRLERWGIQRKRPVRFQNKVGGNQEPNWDKNWIEVATELCRVDDGLSEGLDFSGFTKAQHRVQRLKALGNAIVPQIAIGIMEGIDAF